MQLIKEPKIYQKNRALPDPAMYVPSFWVKAPAFTFTLSLAVGYGRLLFMGFHPVLQGLLLGLVMGTIAGKLFLVEGKPLKHTYEFILWTLALLIISTTGQLIGMKWALPEQNISFLIESWFLNDFRETLIWNPMVQTKGYAVAQNQVFWLTAQIADALAFAIAAGFALKKVKPSARRLKGNQSEWPVYRMVLLVSCFLFSLYYTSKPLIKENKKALTVWVEEIWSDQIMDTVYSSLSVLLAPNATPESYKIEDLIKSASSSKYPFPEGHLWLALKHIKKGSLFLAKDELDRAIFATERLSRKIKIPTGEKLNREQLLAHLYQLRAKLSLNKGKYLVSERDLTVAIFLHQDYWLKNNYISEHGLYPHESETLLNAQYSPHFGFGSCHYERYLARLNLDEKQALKDLEDARSLGYDPVEEY